VPAGYRTDFASIPRVVWSLLPPVGRSGKAAVIHDWLCDVRAPAQRRPKMAADIINEALAVLGEPAWRRAIMASFAFLVIGGSWPNWLSILS